MLPMRHPLSLAKELVTLHYFSEGRLILGAGSGWVKEQFAAPGVSSEQSLEGGHPGPVRAVE
jgi:alkanesulfonate monooxygenase SsuD/methylene tetrahydromethanopterin reductase-like flavin-dependent oxidoreductase (luciferase family)